MSLTTLIFEIDPDGIAVATVNRPDKLNALNNAVVEDLGALAALVSADPKVKALIITGAGPKAFVAGADITELAAVDRASGKALAERGQTAFRAIELLPIPVIAAVNGFALGGGCELAMACHLRVASARARFGQPEVRLGLIPGYGGTVRLPRLVGSGRALEILLTARMVAADEAAAIGLVNRLVDEGEDVVESARSLAKEILTMGPRAVALCLGQVDRIAGLGSDEAHALEAEAFAEACGTEDKSEGTQAFLEKRPAVFHGR